MLKFILASESPRRKALLEQIGIKFDVVIPDIDENINEATPDKLVSRLSQMKAESVCKSNKTDIVIAADTVVCLSDGRVLNLSLIHI